jgi:hypothetical protein
VSYHEAFWVATAAAAPVITVAIVVAMPDTSATVWAVQRSAEEYKADVPPGPDEDWDRGLRAMTGMLLNVTVVYIVEILNLLVQAGLLAVSLSALAAGRNVTPPWIAIVMAVVGTLLLAWSITSTAQTRRRINMFEAERLESVRGND